MNNPIHLQIHFQLKFVCMTVLNVHQKMGSEDIHRLNTLLYKLLN